MSIYYWTTVPIKRESYSEVADKLIESLVVYYDMPVHKHFHLQEKVTRHSYYFNFYTLKQMGFGVWLLMKNNGVLPVS